MAVQNPLPFEGCLVSCCFLLHSVASVGRDRLGSTHFRHGSVLWCTQEMACSCNCCPGPQQELKVSALLPTAISDVLGEGTYFLHTSTVAQMQI